MQKSTSYPKVVTNYIKLPKINANKRKILSSSNYQKTDLVRNSTLKFVIAHKNVSRMINSKKKPSPKAPELRQQER